MAGSADREKKYFEAANRLLEEARSRIGKKDRLTKEDRDWIIKKAKSVSNAYKSGKISKELFSHIYSGLAELAVQSGDALLAYHVAKYLKPESRFRLAEGALIRAAQEYIRSHPEERKSIDWRKEYSGNVKRAVEIADRRIRKYHRAVIGYLDKGKISEKEYISLLKEAIENSDPGHIEAVFSSPAERIYFSENRPVGFIFGKPTDNRTLTERIRDSAYSIVKDFVSKNKTALKLGLVPAAAIAAYSLSGNHSRKRKNSRSSKEGRNGNLR